MDANIIIDNFKMAFPGEVILAHTFKTGGACSFTGQKLIDVQLKDGSWLRLFKLNKSSADQVHGDDIKVKLFPFVYDTKSMTDGEQRRDLLKEKLKVLYPQHNIHIFVFGDGLWARYSVNTKGNAYFAKEYGSEIDVILS